MTGKASPIETGTYQESHLSSDLPAIAGKYLLLLLCVFLTNCQTNLSDESYTVNNQNDTISILLENLVSDGKVTGVSAAIKKRKDASRKQFRYRMRASPIVNTSRTPNGIGQASPSNSRFHVRISARECPCQDFDAYAGNA